MKNHVLALARVCVLEGQWGPVTNGDNCCFYMLGDLRVTE